MYYIYLFSMKYIQFLSLYVAFATVCMPNFVFAQSEASVLKTLSVPVLYEGSTSTEVTTVLIGTSTGTTTASSTNLLDGVFSSTTNATSSLDVSTSSTEVSTTTQATPQQEKSKEIVIVGSVVRMQSTSATNTDRFVTVESGTSTSSTSPVLEIKSNIYTEEENISTSSVKAKTTPPEPSVVRFVPEKVETKEDLEQFAEVIARYDEKVEKINFSDNKIAINYESTVKLLGVFPINLTQEISIQLDGGVDTQPKVKVRFPWWHIFARKDTEVNALKEKLESELLVQDVKGGTSDVGKAKVLNVINTTLSSDK